MYSLGTDSGQYHCKERLILFFRDTESQFQLAFPLITSPILSRMLNYCYSSICVCLKIDLFKVWRLMVELWSIKYLLSFIWISYFLGNQAYKTAPLCQCLLHRSVSFLFTPPRSQPQSLFTYFLLVWLCPMHTNVWYCAMTTLRLLQKIQFSQWYASRCPLLQQRKLSFYFLTQAFQSVGSALKY